MAQQKSNQSAANWNRKISHASLAFWWNMLNAHHVSLTSIVQHSVLLFSLLICVYSAENETHVFSHSHRTFRFIQCMWIRRRERCILLFTKRLFVCYVFSSLVVALKLNPVCTLRLCFKKNLKERRRETRAKKATQLLLRSSGRTHSHHWSCTQWQQQQRQWR